MKIRFLTIISFVLLLISCSSAQENKKESAENNAVKEWDKSASFVSDSGLKIEKVVKSEADWGKELNEKEFYVLRKKGTERAFTSDLLTIKEKGIYVCKACGLPLFDGNTKYKSGTGWPSFYAPVEDAFILRDTDYDLGYARTEVMCMRCKGHLGHVFEDGPQPTGLRYCINGVSLEFEKGKTTEEILTNISTSNN